MKNWFFLTLLLISSAAISQQVTVSGTAHDTTNGVNAIEVVLNDTLSKIMKDPKKGRQLYLKLYQNPRFVVRTDSTGAFKIKADPTDTIYFKSFRHKTQAYPVSELLRRKKISIELKQE